MHFAELLLIAVGLSMDAFAVAVCKGLSVKELRPRHALLAVVVGTWLGKTYSMGAIAGAVAMIAVTVMVVDPRLILILTALIALLVLVRHIPAIRRMIRKEEEKISLEQDISYKFDEKF